MLPAKILIVDDKKIIADSLKEGLEKEGYDVVTASSGEEGLEKDFIRQTLQTADGNQTKAVKLLCLSHCVLRIQNAKI